MTLLLRCACQNQNPWPSPTFVSIFARVYSVLLSPDPVNNLCVGESCSPHPAPSPLPVAAASLCGSYWGIYTYAPMRSGVSSSGLSRVSHQTKRASSKCLAICSGKSPSSLFDVVPTIHRLSPSGFNLSPNCNSDITSHASFRIRASHICIQI